MKKFLKQILFRLSVLLLACAVIFCIRWKTDYYGHLPDGSQYGKATWDLEKLKTMTIDSNTVVFIGSSLCQHGINDSLLSRNSKTRFINLAIPGSCNALSLNMLKRVLLRGKPKKVYFTLKFYYTLGIHPIWPMIEEPSVIASSIFDGNANAVKSVFYHIGWNINYLTRCVKHFKKTMPSYTSTWGHEAPSSSISQKEFEANYEDCSQTFMKLLLNQEKELKGEKMARPDGWLQFPRRCWQDLYHWDLRKLQNADYQDFMLNKACELCESEGVDYDLIYFPTVFQIKEKKSHITADYYARFILKNVNTVKHRILFYEPEELTAFDCWEDMGGHLNEKGATIQTTAFMKDTLK